MKLESYKNDGNRREYTLVALTRDAGSISRFHTYGQKNYNVAQHTYNMMQLLIAIYPDPIIPDRLVKGIMSHDGPEMITGDIPSPAKAMSVLIAKGVESVELTVMERLYTKNANPRLAVSEEVWLRGLDIVEIYLWLLEEVARGDRSNKIRVAVAAIRRCAMDRELPEALNEFFLNVEVNGWDGVVASEVELCR